MREPLQPVGSAAVHELRDCPVSDAGAPRRKKGKIEGAVRYAGPQPLQTAWQQGAVNVYSQRTLSSVSVLWARV